MSRAQEELGKYFVKNKPSTVIDEREFDVVVVNRESRMVECITVWRRVSVDRCLKLVEREMRGFSEKDECVAVLSGRAIIGAIINELDVLKI